MTRVYISHSHIDKNLARTIADGLRNFGNEVFIDSESIQAGSDWRSTISDSLKQSDVFVILITEAAVASQYVISEVGAARAYLNSSPNEKALIPVVIGNLQIPDVIKDIHALFGEQNDIAEVIQKIQQAIDAFSGRRVAEEQKREQRKQRIEATAASYIQEAIESLQQREEKLSKKASLWNTIGWGSLIIGVLAAIVLLVFTLNRSNETPFEWPEVSFLAIKSIIIVTLLVASSKYAFTLANSYMSESLKNADRIHAISFGKFFLQAFGDNVDTKEVKEVFQHWNISHSSSFAGLDADKFDPKVVEAILSVAKVVDKSDSKNKS